jgi:predicted nucleic acid-binding protein
MAFNGHQPTIDRLRAIGLEQISLSAITVMELYQGMGNKMELAQMKKKMKYFDVVEIDGSISKLSIVLMENYKLSHGLQIPDAIIGATAITIQCSFFTYNTKDFDFMPGIRLI